MITVDQLLEFLKTSPHYKWYKSLMGGDAKYFSAFKYIYDNRPMYTLEYGGGRSTHTLTLFINELNYGGRVIGIEENQEFYDEHVSNGSNEFNNILKAGGNVDGRFFTYIHDEDVYKDVDFLILDGPNYRFYGDACGITTNLKECVDFLGNEVPYFIDGRTGCVNYYKNELGYTSEIVDVKNSNNEKYIKK
jgi:hypothetical protein